MLSFLYGMSIVQRIFPGILLNVNSSFFASRKTVKGVKIWLSHSKFFRFYPQDTLFIDTVKGNSHCLQFKQAD